MSDGIYVDNDNLHYTNSNDRDAGQRRCKRISDLEGKVARLTAALEYCKETASKNADEDSHRLSKIWVKCDEALTTDV